MQEIVFGMLRVQRTPVTVVPSIAGLLLSGVNDIHKILLLSLAIFFFHISASVLNDLADYETDKVSAPDRPLVREVVSQKQAELLVITFISIALITVWILDQTLFFIAITLGITLEVIYNFGLALKNNPIGSYLYLSSSTSLVPFLVGCFVARNIKGDTVTLGFLLMIFSSGIIVSSLKDVAGDVQTGKRTVPVVLGVDKAKKLIAFIFVLPAFLYTIIPYFFGLSYAYFLYCVIPAAIRVFLANSVYKNPSQENARKLVVVVRALIVFDAINLMLAHPKSVLNRF